SLIADYFDEELELPEHHVAFNAIGDADRCAAALLRADAIVRRSPAPVLNAPANILQTGRVANAKRLGAIEGVTTAFTELFERNLFARDDAAAALAGRGIGWPLLLRAPGFHTGHHFLKVDEPAALPEAVRALPGDTLLAMQ